VIPLYTSHLLQPLDISISSPLIRAFSAEIEKLFRLDTRRTSRTEWTETFMTARANTFISRAVKWSFRASGIYPLSPITILSTLRMPTLTSPTTPLRIATPSDLGRPLPGQSGQQTNKFKLRHYFEFV
jgi:hypothetical protein